MSEPGSTSTGSGVRGPDGAELPQITGYDVFEHLGRGATATVYLARQVAELRDVALKIMPADGDQQTVARVVREAKAALALDHPNLVACYDAGQSGGNFYLAMELMTGGDANQAALDAGGALREELALKIVRDAAFGLQAIEAAGLIHRDIKPGNIFLSPDGAAKLGDFGLARLADDETALTATGVPVGTPAYMAPEQARADARLDIRCDIYALGATLYRLLAGRPPFIGDNPVEVVVQLLNDPVPDIRQFRDTTTDETVTLLDRALRKWADDRYQTVADFLDALQDALVALSGRVGVTRVHVKPTTEDVPVIPEALGADAQQEAMERLRGRVHHGEDGLSAWIHLAPGATFPPLLLEQLLDAAKIIYGRQEAAIYSAGAATEQPRRLVIARGDAPRPASAGKDIFGRALPPLAKPLQLVVAEDAMSATAHLLPGAVLPQELVQKAVREIGVRHGMDVAVVQQLFTAPGIAAASVRIAVGTPPDAGSVAGFRLGEGDALAHLARVESDQRIATWSPMRPARPGMDVLGRTLPVAAVVERPPEDFLGEGVEIRLEGGHPVLYAIDSGTVQLQGDGRIRIVQAMTIDGDLGPDSTPIETDGLVIVRGSVRSGAHFESAGDLVVSGDIEDATLNIGGSIEVQGSIMAGGEAVACGDTLFVHGDVQRRILAGSVTIEGALYSCDVAAAGDVSVGTVVGGTITAGGSISALRAGDENGATTHLWAGHFAAQNDRVVLDELTEKRLAGEARRASARTHQAHRMLQSSQAHSQRVLTGAMFVKDGVAEDLQYELKSATDRLDQLEFMAERARKRLARQRQKLSGHRRERSNGNAVVEVAIGHPGVILQVADGTEKQLTNASQGVALRMNE